MWFEKFRYMHYCLVGSRKFSPEVTLYFEARQPPIYKLKSSQWLEARSNENRQFELLGTCHSRLSAPAALKPVAASLKTPPLDITPRRIHRIYPVLAPGLAIRQ